MTLPKKLQISTGFLILQWVGIALMLVLIILYLWHYGLPPLSKKINPIETVFEAKLEGIAEKVVRDTKLYDLKVALKVFDDKETTQEIILWVKDQRDIEDVVEKLKSGQIYLVRPEPKTQLVYIGQPVQPYLNVERKGDRMVIVTNDPDIIVPYKFNKNGTITQKMN
jgi:hypothetical protein